MQLEPGEPGALEAKFSAKLVFAALKPIHAAESKITARSAARECTRLMLLQHLVRRSRPQSFTELVHWSADQETR